MIVWIVLIALIAMITLIILFSLIALIAMIALVFLITLITFWKIRLIKIQIYPDMENVPSKPSAARVNFFGSGKFLV